MFDAFFGGVTVGRGSPQVYILKINMLSWDRGLGELQTFCIKMLDQTV